MPRLSEILNSGIMNEMNYYFKNLHLVKIVILSSILLSEITAFGQQRSEVSLPSDSISFAQAGAQLNAQLPVVNIPSYNGFPPAFVPVADGASATSLKASTSGATASGTSKQNITPSINYDPALDNHLAAPATPIGLFGCPIQEVERELSRFGARPYSYAFGKYSRFTLSVYLLTLYFDRARRLGKVEIVPKPPFSVVEPFAQKELLAIFLKGSSLESLKLEVGKGTFIISYSPADKPAEETRKSKP
ncbi:MAG: hypothetical protein HQM09_15605 [Candidatus Riflebacteria bacterium]|nr:hypothetical protein [Candidatus Riflebacteria bacterium]